MNVLEQIDSKEPPPDHKTGWITSPRFLDHDTGRGHPECARRLTAIHEQMERSGLLKKVLPLEPNPLSTETLRSCHRETYLARAQEDIESGAPQLSTGDTAVCPESWVIARLSAGAGQVAIDAVMAGAVQNAFCAVRPPGHHASPGRGMGFCVLNNIALAARHAQRKHGIERVLIVDWDVHHGNGTQDFFYEDDSVLFFSTHQSPWYPGTGARDETGRGRGLGTTINVPLPSGTGATQILSAFRQRLLPAAAQFRPDLVLISAGFDSRRGDPLGEFLLDDEDFQELTRITLQIAADHAENRLVSFLEGGYSLEGVAKGVVAHVTELIG